MSKEHSETMLYSPLDEKKQDITEIIRQVYASLIEKNYNPQNQIIGYILSGDPTYITSHKDARKLIRQIDRDELLEELLMYYVDGHDIKSKAD